MNSDQAAALVRKPYRRRSTRHGFSNFGSNLLNEFDESKACSGTATYVKDAFKAHVQRYERLGTYTSPGKRKARRSNRPPHE